MVSHNFKNQNSRNFFLNNYFNAILAGVLILFLAVAYFAFLGPKFRATEAAILMNIEEQRRLYENQQKKLASLQAIAEVYKKISPADLVKFNSVLPDDYARERLFGELAEIVSRGGWLVTSIQIDQPAEGVPPPTSPSIISVTDKKVGTINLSLEVMAVDYGNFKKLLRILENNLRLFDISAVEFSPSEDSATVFLTTYFYQTSF
jgi:hypothetical protein